MITKQIHVGESNLDASKLSDLATDGCSVMTGKRNGVAAFLRRECKLLLNVHCICHRLALACGDANDHVAYIQTVEKILVQLWSFFKNSAKKSVSFAKASIAAKSVIVPNAAKKTISRTFKKACRTRWLSTERSISGVFEDFIPLSQTLRVYKEDNDCTTIGLLKHVANSKFLSTVYLLHEVLPALSHLNKAFQRGNISFSAIDPAIKYTIDQINEIAANLNQKHLESLKKDLGEGGRLVSTELTLISSSEVYLRNLTTKYVDSLKENIENRFSESLPVLSAFKIFDPMAIPAAFKESGIPQIEILADHFYQEKGETEELKEELECEWKKFKYNILQLKDEVPNHILHPPKNKNLTPTEWALQHMLSSRTTYQHFILHLLYIAEVCLSLPVSNAWPERCLGGKEVEDPIKKQPQG